MPKITKNLAQIIAKEMASSVCDEQIKSLRAELTEKVTAIVIENIPKQIRELSEKFPSFFTIRNSVSFCDGGTGRIYNLPCERYPSSGGAMLVTTEQIASIGGIQERVREYTDDKEHLARKVEITLISLGTYKRIQEEFPEAYSYIPTKSSKETSLTTPLSELRDIFTLSALKQEHFYGPESTSDDGQKG